MPRVDNPSVLQRVRLNFVFFFHTKFFTGFLIQFYAETKIENQPKYVHGVVRINYINRTFKTRKKIKYTNDLHVERENSIRNIRVYS